MATAAVRVSAAMPRPGQPGALSFDGMEVTEFLERWNFECEDFGIADTQKCRRLPYYCVKEVKDIVEYLEGYRNSD